ncbi:MAG: sugar phosphate isomerase/epimerase family protein [Anaerolineae bacterium]
MKRAINAWTVPGSVTFEDMFRTVAAAGFEGIELNLDREGASAHSLTFNSTQSDYERISGLARQYNLPVCSISTSLYANKLGSDVVEDANEARRVLRKQLECAAALGADGILVVPGGISESRSIQQAYDCSKQTLLELVPEINRARIMVGLENVWNGFFASPFDMARFIDELHCQYIAAYFDVGNVAINAYPEYWIEILGRRICKVHVKDFRRPSMNSGAFVNLLEGSIRWEKVVPALRKIRYDGYLTAELADMPKTPEYCYQITNDALKIICAY